MKTFNYKLLVAPTGHGTKTEDAIKMARLLFLAAVIAVPLGYLGGLGIMVPLALTVFVMPLAVGYGIAHGSSIGAPHRGLFWMLSGILPAFFISWLARG